MKVEDKKIQNVLREAISNIDSEKSLQDTFKKAMVHMYNFPVGDSVDILNREIPVELMSYDTMFKVMKCIYEINKTHNINNSKLNVDDYFNDIENQDYNKKIIDDEIVGEIRTKQWLMVNKDQYLCTFTIEDIVQFRDGRRVRYNTRTQRQTTIRAGKESVTLNPESGKEIHELMEKNKFISNDITFNINPDFYEEPYIDGEDLVIPSGSKIDIIDGFHQWTEMTNLKDENPNWEYNCIVNVMVFDEDKALIYILQKDKKNHFAKSHATKINKDDEVNYLLDKLNKSRDFHLNGQITDDTYATLNTIINKLYTVNDKKMKRQEALDIYPIIQENVNNAVEENKQVSTGISIKEWFIYLYITKYCTDNNLEFMDILNKIDVNKIIEQLNFKKQPTPTQYKIIKEVLENV